MFRPRTNSRQRVSQAFKGKPSTNALLHQIQNPTDLLRASLSGDMAGALTGLSTARKTSGTFYAALYELGDEELIKKLEVLGKRLQIVLSNSVATENTRVKDPKTGKNKKTAHAR